MAIPPFVIRFSDAAVQPALDVADVDSPARRIVGTVSMRHLLPLFHASALDPNPRSARVNRVTSEITGSLSRTPELFKYKSKGVLLGTAHYESLQRNRFRLSFEDTTIEGILDGGHNMLAIGLHILAPHMDPREHKRIKSWDDLMGQWPKFLPEIEAVKGDLTTEVPVEMLVPAADDDETIESFTSALVDICSARNNNAVLPLEAAANKMGLYDEIKEQMTEEFARRVEWRPNSWEDVDEERPIQVRDLLALAWIPLNLLNEHNALPEVFRVSPQNIYRNKGECSKQFESLMRHEAVTRPGDASRRELKHKGVRSAIKILADLPELYDLIYEEFPDAYNANNKRFRANPIVKQFDPDGRATARLQDKDTSGYIASHPLTPFLRREVKAAGNSNPCTYPDGLIVPLVYGLQGLMTVADGQVRWAVTNPKATVKRMLPNIAVSYQLVLDMGRWDPQKIAKNPSSHEFAVQQFRSLMRLAS